MIDDFNYWEETQYYPICSKCGCKITPTRWCSRECWINQRQQYNDNIPTEPKKEIKNIEDWKTLKLNPPKTKDEIKKQYHKLALIYHPDKQSGNHNLFTQLNASYSILIST